jgi:antitoxin component YwqK of YwqJK toxin-antitoxin module
MSIDKLSRVHYDDIDFDDQLALLDDVPFTGIIYANYHNDRPEIEFNYSDGLPCGVQRRWYPDGQLEEEWDAVRGQGSAWSRKWYPNGIMKSERVNEDNLPVRIREWSEDGQLLSETTSNNQDCGSLSKQRKLAFAIRS